MRLPSTDNTGQLIGLPGTPVVREVLLKTISTPFPCWPGNGELKSSTTSPLVPKSVET
jgi:hypothetical protein